MQGPNEPEIREVAGGNQPTHPAFSAIGRAMSRLDQGVRVPGRSPFLERE
jgi:hypothetical protein